MLRRQFLRAALAGLAAGGLARSSLAFALGAEDYLRDFRAARADAPWLAGWDSLRGEDIAASTVPLEGRLPKALRGTLFRNGPALSERDGLRYQHWFDGDGMVQAWRVDDGKVSHQGRMVRTLKFEREQSAKRFLVPAPGTHIPNASAIRNNDDFNTANTALLAHRGELLALWEGGSPWRLDPGNLQTLGLKSFRDDLSHVPFSAHPVVDSDGSLWNFGLVAYGDVPQLLVWHIAASGEVLSIDKHDLPYAGYLHSFAASAGHLVFVLSPLVLGADSSLPYFERMQWKPQLGSHVLVVPKSASATARRFETEAGLTYHWADAQESAGQLRVRGCWYRDGAATNDWMSDLMRGRTRNDRAHSQFAILELDLKRAGRAQLRLDAPRDIEFPCTAPGGRLFAVQTLPRATAPFAEGAIVALDRDGQVLDSYRYGSDFVAEEHLYVAQGAGFLIGTALDWKRGQTCLSVFAAARLADGPLAQARLPRTLPLGFHGTYLPS